MYMKHFLLLMALVAIAFTSQAHVGIHGPDAGMIYTIRGNVVEGHFLMSRDDKIFIELTNGRILSAPLTDFSMANRDNLSEKIAALKRLNREKSVPMSLKQSHRNTLPADVPTGLLYGIVALLVAFLLKKVATGRFAGVTAWAVALVGIFYACKTDPATSSTSISPTPTTTKTDPAFIESTFSAFKSVVKTRFDDTYFYIESDGMPTHPMMIGITSWQQQVPIPQGYTGTNAWSIPLKPELASAPLSLKSNFMKGAVAIAPNGIPIFNPLNNRGEDSYAIGELDKWGGHCGRADDYHYHIAPLHFESTAGNNPIAMALDGFAIYGSKEPDGSMMQPLDEYHGHTYKNGTYHYHATTTYPYFMAAMRGNVTLDPTTNAPENQIIPQAKTTAIRPAGDPLKGATITDFNATGVNAYSLEYTLSNQKGYVNYAWDNAGKYTYTFIGTDGKSTTVTYTKK